MSVIKGMLDFFKDKAKVSKKDINDNLSINESPQNVKISYYEYDIKEIIDDLQKVDDKYYNELSIFKSKLKIEKKLAAELNNYQKKYVLPQFLFTEKEWLELMNVLIDYFTSINRKEDAYKFLSYIQKRTIATSLVDNESSINIDNYLNNLQSINMECEDISKIRKSIINNTGYPKIVDINNYAKRKEKKKQMK